MTSSRTLGDARDIVTRHLDDFDESGARVRWTTAEIDLALQAALSSALTRYVGAGGDRFDEEVSASTTSGGALDLSTYDPLEVRGVTFVDGGRYWPLSAMREEERKRHVESVRALVVRLVRTYTLSTNTSDKLVSYGSDGTRTAAKSWEAFDHLVCALAADQLSAKDGADRPELKGIVAQLDSAVMSLPSIPGTSRFPRRVTGYSASWGWIYKPGTQVLQLCNRGGW